MKAIFISKTIDGVQTKVIIRRGGCGKIVEELEG